jgi:hypothetical protein
MAHVSKKPVSTFEHISSLVRKAKGNPSLSGPHAGHRVHGVFLPHETRLASLSYTNVNQVQNGVQKDETLLKFLPRPSVMGGAGNCSHEVKIAALIRH